jgi:hypothetical protein
MEKVKAFFAKYKWLAVGLLAVVFVVVYKLLRGGTSESAGVVQGFSPAPSTGGGAAGTDNTSQALSAIKDVISDSSKAQADAAKAQQDSQTSFLTGLVNTMGSFMGGIKDTLSAQNKATASALKGIADSNEDFRSDISNLLSSSMALLKTPAVMPDVPIVRDIYRPSSTARQQEDPYDTNIGKKVVSISEASRKKADETYSQIRSTGKAVLSSSMTKTEKEAYNQQVLAKMKASNPGISSW